METRTGREIEKPQEELAHGFSQQPGLDEAVLVPLGLRLPSSPRPSPIADRQRLGSQSHPHGLRALGG